MNPPADTIQILGMGLCSALGDSVDTTWNLLLENRSAVGCTSFENSAFGKVEATLGMADIPVAIDRPADRMAFLLRKALDESLTSAAMPAAYLNGLGERALLLIGISYGDIFSNDNLAIDHFIQAVLDDMDLRIPYLCVSSACSSSNDAIATAGDLLLAGRVDVVIAGGVDTLDVVKIVGHQNLGTLSPEIARPFHQDRAGTNFGEAAAFLVLYRDQGRAVNPTASDDYGDGHAACRSSMVWLCGWASSSDLESLTAPDAHARGATYILENALRLANARKSEVAYINAHGSGTAANDTMEAACYTSFFGSDRSQWPLISSTKAALGHSLGATGAAEAIVTIKCLQENRAVATFGLDKIHEAWAGYEAMLVQAPCELPAENKIFGVNMTFGFGGANAATVFKMTRPCL